MDIDKTRKPKKEKPYVLIFVVLAVLYLAYAIIWELLPVNASSPSTLGSSYVICMPSDGRDVRPSGAGDFYRYYSDGTDPLGLHDVIKIDDITMSTGNWSNGQSISSWLQNSAYVLTMDAPVVAGYLQFKQGWYGRTLIYGSIDMPQYVTGIGIDTMPFDRVTAWPAYVNGVYYVDTNGLYCLSRSSHLLYTHFSPSLAEYASERLYFSDNSEEPNPVLVYRDGVWTEEPFENTVHTSETPHAVQKILNAGQGFVFFEIYDPDGYYVTKDYIPDDIGCWIEYTAFESDNTAIPTPTEGPTPTLEPVGEPTLSFIAYGKPFWSNTSLGVPTTNNYFLIDVWISEYNVSTPISLEGNSALAYAMSQYGVESPWIRTVYLNSHENSVGSTSYNSTQCNLYFSGTIYKVQAYNCGTALASHNKSILRDGYTPVDIVVNPEASSYEQVLFGENLGVWNSNGLGCIALFLGRESYSSIKPQLFDFSAPVVELELGGLPFYGSSRTSVFNYNSLSTSNSLVQAYRVGLTNSSISAPTPTPTPTPDPNATPTPEPTPTPQTVIINWPTGTPTPTPMGVLNVTMPPYGNELNVPTSRNVLGSGLNLLRSRAQTGLLAKAFSFVPTELQTLIWFLVFVLIILAVIRLIIHFGG